jgi:hypothetical protein
MSENSRTKAEKPPPTPSAPAMPAREPAKPRAGAKEVGGPAGPEPTRYGDWEIKGRCIDF